MTIRMLHVRYDEEQPEHPAWPGFHGPAGEAGPQSYFINPWLPVSKNIVLRDNYGKSRATLALIPIPSEAAV
jgi:hypothetical protein